VGGEQKYTQYFLDAVIYEYLSYKRERRAQTRETTFLSIMEKVVEYQADIEDLEQQKLVFQRKNNIVFLQEQGNNAGTYLAELNNNRAQLRTELNRLAAMDLAGLGGQNNAVSEAIIEASLIQNDEDYAEIRHSLDMLKAERDEFTIFMKPKHPKIIALNRDIERQQNLLNIHRRKSIRTLTNRISEIRSEVELLEQTINYWENQALKYSSLLAEFDRIKSRLQSVKSLHDRLLSSIQSLDLSKNLDQESVAILEPATPAYPPPANLAKQLTIGGVIGIVAGIGILILYSILDNRIITISDVSSRYEAPILGIVPIQNTINGKLPLLRKDDERLMFAESCRNIRSSLLFMDRSGLPPQVILITSSIPAEGKSVMVGNLGVTLGLAASRVLAIDADLRRGQLHEDFGLDNSVGFSSLLQDKSLQIEDVIQHTNVGKLDIIPCGPYPEQPGELLLSERFNRILEQLRLRYDFIVFDCPPVLATDDTPTFATKADAVLFVVRTNYTRQRQIKTSLDTLELRGVIVRGFVLNFVSKGGLGNYYYKYYDYYSYRSNKPGKKEEKYDEEQVG